MFSNPSRMNKALPDEFRKIAEALFPSNSSADSSADGKGPSVEAACNFAGILGIDEDYRKLLGLCKSGKAAEDFLELFQNNLDLLIQKTWVEKAEETRKEDLLDKVPPFIALIENKKYSEALEEFGAIMEELSHLFFGAQSQKEDFTEYALRIDPLLGLFWWYGRQLGEKRDWLRTLNEELLCALLLLGICFLTDF